MAEEENISTRRLEALTDGIFAFSMTLLVIFIDTPQFHHLNSPEQLQRYLMEQYPQFVSYLITFLVVANFWIIHHHISRFITKTNIVSLWLNILFMLFIVLLPFSSMIVGDFPMSWGSIFLFVVNLFCICTLLFIIWLYASRHKRLTSSDLNYKKVKEISIGLLIGVFYSALSIVISFFNVSIALYIYLLIPVTRGVLKFFKK